MSTPTGEVFDAAAFTVAIMAHVPAEMPATTVIATATNLGTLGPSGTTAPTPGFLPSVRTVYIPKKLTEISAISPTDTALCVMFMAGSRIP